MVLACQSNSVLTPIENRQVVVEGAESAQGPTLAKLNEVLAAQRYQGVGMQFESESTQEALTKIFSDPRTWNRQISLVYTGVASSYDARHRSLTVPISKELELVIAYIVKTVPQRPPEPATAPAKTSPPTNKP